MAKKSGKKSVTDIGNQVPGNFKFAVIVAVAIFWVDFLRSVLNTLFSYFNFATTIFSDFLIAVVVTLLAYFVLLSYRRLRSRLKNLKV